LLAEEIVDGPNGAVAVTASENGSEAWLAEAERARHRPMKSRMSARGGSEAREAERVGSDRCDDPLLAEEIVDGPNGAVAIDVGLGVYGHEIDPPRTIRHGERERFRSLACRG
jgi:hypothetical protein